MILPQSDPLWRPYPFASQKVVAFYWECLVNRRMSARDAVYLYFGPKLLDSDEQREMAESLALGIGTKFSAYAELMRIVQGYER